MSLSCRLPQSAFFGLGVGVSDDRQPGLAAAYRLASGAPSARPLEGVARFVQHPADGVGGDARQAIGGRPQGLAEQRQRPGCGAVSLRRGDPCCLAEDALAFDTTNMDVETAVREAIALIERRLAGRPTTAV